MTSQASCLRGLSLWVLILGASLTSAPITQAAGPANSPSDLERFCNPPSGPTRPCPQIGPVDPKHLRSPQEQEMHVKQVREQHERMIREAEAQALSRPLKPAPQTGIISTGGKDERLGSSYLVENKWYEILNGEEIVVYAASRRTDPDGAVRYDPLTVHGLVVIDKGGSPGQPKFRTRQIYTPTAVGSLRIIAANGNVLTLQSRQGNQFLLNVETEQLTPLGAR